jgi:hypothetical protein
MPKTKFVLHIVFILLLTFISSHSYQQTKPDSESNYFFSFLKVFEFFKDASPSSNKMMNFHHYETSHNIVNLLQSHDDDKTKNASNCTNNETSQDNKSKELTPEDIQKMLHKENQALKKEITTNEQAIEKDLKNSEEKMENKLDEAEVRIGDKIVKSQEILEKKIGKLEEKVDENIQQTEEASIIIISQQIEEKEKDLETLKADIQELREIVNNEQDLTDVCSLYSACDECTTNPKCGWCILEGRCVGGDNLGPKEDQCTFYTYHYCSTLSCARNTDCYVSFNYQEFFQNFF